MGVRSPVAYITAPVQYSTGRQLKQVDSSQAHRDNYNQASMGVNFEIKRTTATSREETESCLGGSSCGDNAFVRADSYQ
jgi:hypothetical protein